MVLLNEDLVMQQDLTSMDVSEIKALHMIREWIERRIFECLDDPNEIKNLVRDWTNNQYALQEAWKFPRDAKYHKFWKIPACTCPTLDNEDRYPSGYYVINCNCEVHGYERETL